MINNIVSAIDPLLTKPVLTMMYKSTKTMQRQFQKYGGNSMKFRIAKNILTQDLSLLSEPLVMFIHNATP